MLSILSDIFTSDDIHDFEYDASDVLRFLLKYYGWNWAKNEFCGSFWESFCLHPLTPYELRLKILPNERPY